MSLIGLDVGTSGCKAALFSETGQMLAAAYAEYDNLHPQPGWAELDAVDVWAKVCRSLRHVAACPGAGADPVKALAVSSLGEASVPVSRDRQILGPSILNFDSRGREYLAGLRAGLSAEALSAEALSAERLYQINGNTLGNNYGLTKLMWIKEHQLELYERTYKFLNWGCFVSFMLGAEPVIDYSLANRLLLFDLEDGDWSAELLAWARLDREKLPAAAPSGTVIGQMEAGLAGELGLPSNVAIVTGAHDQCANAVGCGGIQEGRPMYGMGTFLCAVPVFSQPRPAAAMIERGLNTEHHAVPGCYVSFIYNQGGSLFKWYRDTFAAVERRQAAAEGVDIYARLLAEMPSEPSRVMVLPHFTVTGPPQFIDDSSGVLVGLTLETSRAEILKGILEGATFYMRQVLETLPGVGIQVDGYRAVGGGSKSDAWLQLSADILGKPLVRAAVSEAGALGAAILAGSGAGLFSSMAEGCQAMVRLGQEFEPDARRQSQYERRFAKYQKLWPLMAAYLRELADPC
ncbi:MAG: FGGY family carbohydrate kinase [Anaerolineaceae bacterium]|nr:FGGY family carbohydrate kinase [Anaerolineaceae bacterium]